MTPEQKETADQILNYALGKLRAVELQHEARPSEIFGELLRELVALAYEVQQLKSAAAGKGPDLQLFELVGAIWGDGCPPGVTHELTLERLHQMGDALRDQEARALPDPADPPASHFAGALEGAETEKP